jgi:hypothetical protein
MRITLNQAIYATICCLSNFSKEREEKNETLFMGVFDRRATKPKCRINQDHSDRSINVHFFLGLDRWIPGSPTRYKGSAAKDRFHYEKEAIASPRNRKTDRGSRKFFKSGKQMPDEGKRPGQKNNRPGSNSCSAFRPGGPPHTRHSCVLRANQSPHLFDRCESIS